MVSVAFLCFYIISILLVGFSSKKKIKGISEYFMGGRTINPWLSAFSYGTAYFSAVLFIGYAGKIGWSFGVSSLWIVLGNTIVGSFLAWQVLGRKTREVTTRLDVSTMPEFIGVRYKSRALKIVTAAIIFVFLIPYSASVYKGLGYLFEKVFGFPYMVVLLIMTFLTALYLFLGGFLAATRADFIQGLIMIAGVVLMLIFVIRHPVVGGLERAISNLNAIDPRLVQPVGPPGIVPLISLVILTSLGCWGLPQMVHKFYTIRSEKSVLCAKWVSSGFALLITFGAYFTGILSRLFFPDSMPASGGVPDPDLIIPQVISRALPDWVSGIILVLVLSASMSTLAATVLASASVIALDLVKEVFCSDIGKDKLMVLMRVLCVVFVVMSFVLTVFPNHIVSLASISWGAVSGCLLAPYLFGLYWDRVKKSGVWCGILTALGLITYGICRYGINSGQMLVFSAAAIVAPLVVVPAVSLVSGFIFQKADNTSNADRLIEVKEERMFADDLV